MQVEGYLELDCFHACGDNLADDLYLRCEHFHARQSQRWELYVRFDRLPAVPKLSHLRLPGILYYHIRLLSLGNLLAEVALGTRAERLQTEGAAS
jgi:hypothetical protein